MIIPEPIVAFTFLSMVMDGLSFFGTTAAMLNKERPIYFGPIMTSHAQSSNPTMLYIWTTVRLGLSFGRPTHDFNIEK